ncbi:AMP-binding protein [Microbacterium sp. CPCC 204701]|uniref:AMP-binding protein n=1 Tax=Microbacterium sp. CPCC 204701 TaxID=2493084 RepID=UPI0013E38B85|nr:AMP-binding protein [Microbacterium sp. CPCC 204701]
MAQSFWENARTQPDRPALVAEDGTVLSYAEAARLADRWATLFAELGVKPGETVSVMAGNSPSWLVAYIAALQSGLYFTPAAVKATGDDLALIWGDSATRLIIVDQDAVNAASEAADRVGIDPSRRLSFGNDERFVAISAAADALPASAHVPPHRAGIRMMYTGGTTGAPRGIRHPLPEVTPEEAAAPIVASPLLLGMREGDSRHLVSGPLYHGGPLAYATAALHLGSTVVLPAGWSTEKILRMIDEHRVNSTFMVPTMLSRIAAMPESERGAYDLSSLEAIIHGAAPCPPALKHSIMQWLGPVMYEFYAATEAGGTYVTPEEWLERPGTVGRPLPGAEVYVFDEDGTPSPPYQTGRIHMRSRATGELVWPGDLGYFDDAGWLFLTDRVADVIITGGVNVYSATVESRLVEFPGVQECAVIGVADPDWGEAVTAVLVTSWPESERAEREDALRAFAAERLTPAQRPKHYVVTAALALTAAGKVDKRALRSQYAALVGAK